MSEESSNIAPRNGMDPQNYSDPHTRSDDTSNMTLEELEEEVRQAHQLHDVLSERLDGTAQ